MPMRHVAGGVEDSDLGGVGVSGLRWFVGGGTVPMSRQETALPPWVAPGSGGPRVTLGGAVLTVEVSDRLVGRRLAAGEMCCPGCGGVLAPWGWARERVLRGSGDGRVRLRPRRTRCRGCAVTHVLLPVTVLLVDVGVDPVVPAAAGTVVADAVAAIAGAAAAVAARWPVIGVVPPWQA